MSLWPGQSLSCDDGLYNSFTAPASAPVPAPVCKLSDAVSLLFASLCATRLEWFRQVDRRLNLASGWKRYCLTSRWPKG